MKLVNSTFSKSNQQAYFFSESEAVSYRKEILFLLDQFVQGAVICFLAGLLLYPFFLWTYHGLRIVFFVTYDAHIFLSIFRFPLVFISARLALKRMDCKVCCDPVKKLNPSNFRILLYFSIACAAVFTVALFLFFALNSFAIPASSPLLLFLYDVFISPAVWASYAFYFWIMMLPHDLRLLRMQKGNKETKACNTEGNEQNYDK